MKKKNPKQLNFLVDKTFSEKINLASSKTEEVLSDEDKFKIKKEEIAPQKKIDLTEEESSLIDLDRSTENIEENLKINRIFSEKKENKKIEASEFLFGKKNEDVASYIFDDAETLQKKKVQKQIKKTDKSLKQLEEEKIEYAYLREQLKSKKQGKKQKNKRIKLIWGNIHLRRKTKNIILAINIFLFTVALILWLPPFRIKEIEVRGLNKLDKESLIKVSGLKPNQHILSGFGLNLEAWLRFYYLKASNRIKEQYNEIEDVKIYPTLPSKIIMEVKERVPIAYLAIENGYAQIDKQGVVMKLSTQAPEHAPIIEGFREESIKVGEPLTFHLRQEVGRSILILHELIKMDETDGKDFSFIPQIEVIRILNQQRYILQIRRKDKTPLYLKIKLDHQMKEDLNWFVNSLKQGTFERLPVGLIDITGKKRLFMPSKNILPYGRRDLELDEINALTNPILIAEEGMILNENGLLEGEKEEASTLQTDENKENKINN